MPIVVIDPKRGEPASRRVEALVPEGGRLVDVCDERLAPVPLSCKSANCGACRVEVLEGESELLPPEHDELAVLERFGAAARVRLACQATLRPGLARLRIRAVDGDEV